jgi:hypothetical protein
MAWAAALICELGGAPPRSEPAKQSGSPGALFREGGMACFLAFWFRPGLPSGNYGLGRNT